MALLCSSLRSDAEVAKVEAGEIWERLRNLFKHNLRVSLRRINEELKEVDPLKVGVLVCAGVGNGLVWCLVRPFPP